MRRHQSQRYFAQSQLDSRLRAGLVGHWISGLGSGLTWFDSTGYGNHGVLTNGGFWTTGFNSSRIAWGGSGDNDYVEVPSADILDLTHVGTLTSWYYLNVTSASGMIVNRGNIWGDRNGYGLEFYSPSGVLYAEMANGSTYNAVSSTLGGVGNTWIHAVMMWDGTTLYLYINGAQVASGSQTIDATPSGQIFRIGANGGLSAVAPLNGRVDDVRVYNRALSTAEIKCLADPAFLAVVPMGRRRMQLAATGGASIVPILMRQYRQRWA